MKLSLQKHCAWLTIGFWINFAVFAIIYICLFLQHAVLLRTGGKHTPTTTIFDQYGIVLMIIGIPGALKLYQYLINKYKNGDYKLFVKRFFQATYLRVLILDIVIIFNMVGLAKFDSKNAFFLIFITLIALLFCIPAPGILFVAKDTNTTIDHETNEPDNM